MSFLEEFLSQILFEIFRHARDVPDFLSDEILEVQEYLTPIFYSELISAFLAFFSWSYCEEALNASQYLKIFCSVEVGEKTPAAAKGEVICPTGVVFKPIEEVDFGKLIADFDIKVRIFLII